ncbi:MAG: hypothetical protein LBH82_02350 [Bacteroidales bacterium]|jgi:Tol biopolymer transport system component|nr:hypothetical protein [Bacteroidales bacterium]
MNRIKASDTSLIRQIIFAAMVLLFCGIPAKAQFYNGHNLSFGQNRIQHDDRLWSYYRTSLADIYYYPQTKELAALTADYVPSIVFEMEKKLGISLSSKMQIVIFARHSDYQQSNIGLEMGNIHNTGGVTPVHGDKIFLYFKGNIHTFLDDLRTNIAGLFINYFIIGETFGSNVSASYLSDCPIWFTQGLNAYFSKEWTVEFDDVIKDGLLMDRYEKLRFYKLSHYEQQIVGFSFWKYVEEQYGENAIVNILHYVKSTRNYERAIYYALRANIKSLFADWIEYSKKSHLLKPGEDAVELSLLKYRKNTNYISPSLSFDGTQLAYVTNLEGRVKVWILPLDARKKKCIYRHHYRMEDNPDYSYPLVRWHPAGNLLTMMTEYKDKVYFQSYNLEKKKFDKRQVIFINKITDFSYSSDGRYIAVSGVRNGQSDIYVYSMASRSLEQITEDKADDFAPRFIRNNTQIIFSSTRRNDTIGAEDDTFEDGKYDLFMYDFSTKNKQLNRITHTPSANETYPVEAEKDYISFISDLNGINNRYLGKYSNVISRIDTAIHYTYRVDWYPVSNYNTGILAQDINPLTATAVQQVFRNGQWLIGTENYIRFSGVSKRNILTPAANIPKAVPEENTHDTLHPETHQKQLRQIRLSELQMPPDTTNADNEANAVADYPNEKTDQQKAPLLPRNYDVQYYIKGMIAQADFSFLGTFYQQFIKSSMPIYTNPGLNAFLMVNICDLMEDHRMMGGVRISVDLNNLEFLYSYENLKHRLDRQTVLHYQSLKSFDGQYDTRQQNINIHYLLKYPFDKANSIHTTFTFRYNRYDYRSINDYSLHRKPSQSVWVGMKGEYVIDNTRPIATNLLRGFRGKFFAEFSCVPNKAFNNMTVVGIDLRHYTKLHRTLVWANRLAASTSFGKNRLIYYMGGVDNWIFPKFNQEINIDTSVNYTYQTLATNMRGFTQNIRNGTNFFVLNTELRFRIIQCFSQKPLQSEFLQSFQLILFGDMGTAWVGLHPYLEESALLTRTIDMPASRIRITLKKQTEPIVGGFGMGVRFQLLSYFVRLDYAWGVENYRIANKGVFYLSFNLDF